MSRVYDTEVHRLWRGETLHTSPIDSFQQVVFTHRGLFIDGPLNVQVVLIDPPLSLQAARRMVACWG